MAQDQQRLTPEERANLVAYLDGELPESQSRAIATKLTRSPTARSEVAALESTWELLDHLPRPGVRDDFAERTLTEAQRIETSRGWIEETVASVAGHALRVLAWGAMAVACFLAGHAVTGWLFTNPSQRMARDLSIAEHLPEYREVLKVEFLRALASTPEFGADEEE